MKKGKRIILYIIMVILAAVLLFSLWKVLSQLWEYKEADDLYSDVQNQFVGTVAPPTVGDETETPEATEIGTATGETDPTETEAPVDPMKVPVTVNFDGLLAVNRDAVGWIYCPDTPINYPVVQADDNDYYLRRDIYGSYLISGTIFVDYRNTGIGNETNYIIYGHNMNNDTIFGTLLNYVSQSHYDKHPVIYYLTADGDYLLEPIAGCHVTVNDLIYRTEPDEDEFAGYVASLIARSGFKSNATYEAGDNVVTLSTCSDGSETNRFVVVCKVTPADAVN